MFVDDLLSSGALPSLEMTLRFAGQRQQLINHNIANLDTPNFRPVDADPKQFQRMLAEAIDRRREETGGMQGELSWQPTRELRKDEGGELRIEPRTPSPNILFHDRNNRDLDRLMQANAENAAVYRVTTEILRGRYQMMRDAIAERV
jgi:flagellar basal-body rod protein FlgB